MLSLTRWGRLTGVQITAALDATESAFGTPNTAVNCAGIAWAIKVLGRGGEAHDLDKFATTLMVNTVGSFNVIRLSAERMAKAEPDERGERGVIVNTARYDGRDTRNPHRRV